MGEEDLVEVARDNIAGREREERIRRIERVIIRKRGLEQDLEDAMKEMSILNDPTKPLGSELAHLRITQSSRCGSSDPR